MLYDFLVVRIKLWSVAKVGLLHRFIVGMFGLEVDSLSYRTHLPFDSKVATLPFGHMPNHP
jgi:hypothetical protein